MLQFKQLQEFAIAPSKSYKGMPSSYVSASVVEGEKIFDAIQEYVTKFGPKHKWWIFSLGQNARGHLIIMNDLNVPAEYKKKYEKITFRITSNFRSEFKPEGDDDSWSTSRILKDPIKKLEWKYKKAGKDLLRSAIAKKHENEDWEDYNPSIHVRYYIKTIICTRMD